MSNLLTDPSWLAVLAIVIGLILAYLQYQNKSLAYEVISEYKIIGTDADTEGRVEILFDSKPVEAVYLVIIKIINTGRLPIESKDYEYAISLRFNEESEILSSEIMNYPVRLRRGSSLLTVLVNIPMIKDFIAQNKYLSLSILGIYSYVFLRVMLWAGKPS